LEVILLFEPRSCHVIGLVAYPGIKLGMFGGHTVFVTSCDSLVAVSFLLLWGDEGMSSNGYVYHTN